MRGPWSVVADFSSQVATGAPTVGSSLTLTSALGGARFELPRLRRTWIHGAHRVQPFAQILGQTKIGAQQAARGGRRPMYGPKNRAAIGTRGTHTSALSLEKSPNSMAAATPNGIDQIGSRSAARCRWPG